MIMVFKKGESGNIKGRPKGSKNKMSGKLLEDFLTTIKDVEEDEKISQGRTFFKHIISRAYKNDSVAISILRKLIPDQTFNIEEFRNENPIKITSEVIETYWSAREAMVNNNQGGILNILRQFKSGELEEDEAIIKIGDVLLTGKNVNQCTTPKYRNPSLREEEDSQELSE
jgi:hypothetical protein